MTLVPRMGQTDGLLQAQLSGLTLTRLLQALLVTAAGRTQKPHPRQIEFLDPESGDPVLRMTYDPADPGAITAVQFLESQ